MSSPSAEHVAMVGRIDDAHLIASYARAFRDMGWQVSNFDLYEAIHGNARFGAVGRRAAQYLSVEPWIRKGNRDLLVHLLKSRPSLVLVPGSAPLLAGSLAQYKSAVPDSRVVLVWPDTLLNLLATTIQCLPLYDLVASYSSTAMALLKHLGAREIEWVPLAADPLLFPANAQADPSESGRYDCDVCFVGNWRPERERTILALVSAGVSVKVWGHPSWMKQCHDRLQARRYFQGGPLFGPDLAKAIRGGKISLNPIDETNYPAANMRFFESPTCGAATLNSSCPEMEPTFRDGEAAFYYRREEEVASVVHRLLGDDRKRREVAQTGQNLVLRDHTYRHRAELILRRLSLRVT